ncbi:MAG: hypothetical protein KAY32_15010 [Candidatus Eisenbacteria sp.]|nr:hypothetical protein [Candidatus Eisenbacteria bacterium]
MSPGRSWLALLLVTGALCLGAVSCEADGAMAERTEDVGLTFPASDEVINLDALAIGVSREHPREFIFTDKGAAHLAGEAIGPDTRSYHGFYVAMHELVDGWVLRAADGSEIGPGTAVTAEVYPDRLVRHHCLPAGTEVTETVMLFDRANGFHVSYKGLPAGRFAFVPRIDMRFLWRVGKPAYRVEWREGLLRIAREDEIATAGTLDHPAWLAIAVTGAEEFREEGRYVDTTYPKDAARKAMGQASPYIPGAISGRIPSRVPVGRVEVFIAADTSAEAAAQRVRRLRQEADRLAEMRRARLTRLLVGARIRTGAPADDRALAWARISLDNLIMEQRGAGIYAGFYWFTTYWGRDSFIVLPGACLVQGDFATAQTILRSFATFQERDPDSPREGRLPNFVTVEQVQFAGIDGTWWFVRALDELWRRSGDDAFAAEMAPVVFRAVEGALRHAVDEHGFLTHGDGETWMDAGGEAHPYSPRGNRAVEVQALFHRSLRVAARMAGRFGDPGDAARYRDQAERLMAGFREHFWHHGCLVDHLNADNSRDTQVRPNGLLAILASPELFSAEERGAVCGRAARELVTPWGVRSLAADDPAFHSRHLDLERHYYDEAYHNGDVWLWLSGPFISALGDPREGFAQTRMLLDEILHAGAVGTLQEIRDGVEAASNDEFGGATSQAWSLSELLRTVLDDYLGLDVDLAATPPRISVSPMLPDGWPELGVRTRIGSHECWITCRQAGERDAAGSIVLAFREPIPEEWIVSLGWAGEEIAENCNTLAGRALQAEQPWIFQLHRP